MLTRIPIQIRCHHDQPLVCGGDDGTGAGAGAGGSLDHRLDSPRLPARHRRFELSPQLRIEPDQLGPASGQAIERLRVERPIATDFADQLAAPGRALIGSHREQLAHDRDDTLFVGRQAGAIDGDLQSPSEPGESALEKRIAAALRHQRPKALGPLRDPQREELLGERIDGLPPMLVAIVAVAGRLQERSDVCGIADR